MSKLIEVDFINKKIDGFKDMNKVYVSDAQAKETERLMKRHVIEGASGVDDIILDPVVVRKDVYTQETEHYDDMPMYKQMVVINVGNQKITIESKEELHELMNWLNTQAYFWDWMPTTVETTEEDNIEDK